MCAIDSICFYLYTLMYKKILFIDNYKKLLLNIQNLCA